MKKIITILVIFSLLVVFAIWELIFTSKFYSSMHDDLIKIEARLNENPENIDSLENIESIDKVLKNWQKGKEILFCLGNHTILRNVDEKLVSLKAMIESNHKEDTLVTIKTTISLINAIHNDSHPVPSNLF